MRRIVGGSRGGVLAVRVACSTCERYIDVIGAVKGILTALTACFCLPALRLVIVAGVGIYTCKRKPFTRKPLFVWRLVCSVGRSDLACIGVRLASEVRDEVAIAFEAISLT